MFNKNKSSADAMVISEALIDQIKNTIIECGELAESYITTGSLYTHQKSDGTPVSNADIDISNKITECLRKHSSIQVISEEATSYQQANVAGTFWLVDPIDGTKNYIIHDPNYTINVGLIIKGEPLYGFIYKPRDHMMYYVNASGQFIIEKDNAPVARPPIHQHHEIVAVLNNQHDKQNKAKGFLSQYAIAHYNIFYGSSKLAYIAHGYADIYPKFGISMEWDTAAGHAILRAVGGDILDMNYKQLIYGKKNFKNDNFFAFNGAWADYLKYSRQNPVIRLQE